MLVGIGDAIQGKSQQRGSIISRSKVMLAHARTNMRKERRVRILSLVVEMDVALIFRGSERAT